MIRKDSRNDTVRVMREDGKTLQEIADTFNVSRQRVAQILNQLGYHRSDVVKEKRMEQIYNYMISYMNKSGGNSPSTHNIAEKCSMIGGGTVRFYLGELVKEGKIKKVGNTHRYRIVGAMWVAPIMWK